jgi:hypothetical protein
MAATERLHAAAGVAMSWLDDVQNLNAKNAPQTVTIPAQTLLPQNTSGADVLKQISDAPGSDWISAVTNLKASKAVPASKTAPAPKGLPMMTPGMEAFAQGVSAEVPKPPISAQVNANSPISALAQPDIAAALKAHPYANMSGKITGIGLLSTLAPGNPAVNAGLGLASAGGSEAAHRMFPNSTIAPIVGGLAAPLAAGGMVNLAKSLGSGPSGNLLTDLSQRFNVPLTAGEVTNSPLLQRGETLLERAPFSGMTTFRKNQAQALQKAGTDLTNQFNPNVEDPASYIQEAAQNLLAKNKQQAANLYDKVQTLASKTGNVPMTNTQAAAKNAVGMFGGNEDVLTGPSWLGRVGKFADIQPRSFEQARRLRSAVQASARDAQFGSQESNAWNQIQGALEKDMQEHALAQGGELGKAYTDAQNYYRENVVPFKAITQLRNLASGKLDTDTLLNTFVKNDRPQLAQKLMDNLPPEGQQALKYSILNRAMQKATLSGERSGAGFSPARFAQQIENLGMTKNAIFTPDELQMVNGYSKLARVAQRAGYFAENPPTGNRWVDMTMGAGEAALALHNPALAVGAIAGTNGLTKLMTSPMGQKILLRAAKSGSDMELRSLLNQAAKGVISSGQRAAIPAGQQLLRGPILNPGQIPASALSYTPQP